jgi:hypothetical protein
LVTRCPIPSGLTLVEEQKGLEVVKLGFGGPKRPRKSDETLVDSDAGVGE